jgi:hypothetical protein
MYKQKRKRKWKKIIPKKPKTVSPKHSGISLHSIGSGLFHINRHRRRIHKLRRGRMNN